MAEHGRTHGDGRVLRRRTPPNPRPDRPESVPRLRAVCCRQPPNAMRWRWEAARRFLSTGVTSGAVTPVAAAFRSVMSVVSTVRVAVLAPATLAVPWASSLLYSCWVVAVVNVLAALPAVGSAMAYRLRTMRTSARCHVSALVIRLNGVPHLSPKVTYRSRALLMSCAPRWPLCRVASKSCATAW